ncbi:hypothetical protein [Nonomuraea dietziae]|uniref:hypothetical protein n=1 Tax=Nonomuraea dietziae TaxID=65515 RepID=UPI00341DA6C3
MASIDHTYESYATTFADGRVAECLACDSDTDPGFGTGAVAGRAADVSFVLDQLTSTWDGSDLIDRSRIAMAGQSIGGAGSVAAMLKDSWVRAGIDMDGTTYAPIPRSGFSRPFMFMGSPDHVPGGRDGSWERDWKLLTGWKRWIGCRARNTSPSPTARCRRAPSASSLPMASRPGHARPNSPARTWRPSSTST